MCQDGEMIRITFTENEIEQLRKERFGHPHARVQRKMETLLLKSEGLWSIVFGA